MNGCWVGGWVDGWISALHPIPPLSHALHFTKRRSLSKEEPGRKPGMTAACSSGTVCVHDQLNL